MADFNDEHTDGEMPILERPLFGNINAENDDLLLNCYVTPPGTVSKKPLIVGQWGTGKTGHILYTYRELSNQLRKIDRNLERIWYFDENAIDTELIGTLYQQYSDNTHSLKRRIEEIWIAEIIRRYVVVLVSLSSYYGIEKHPKFHIIKAAAGTDWRNSLFKVGSGLLSIFKGRDATDALDALVRQTEKLVQPAVREAVNEIVSAIPPGKQLPVVAIEPIETPNSALEGQAELADIVITCLLNVYQKNFQVTERQNIRLVITVPWHRYKRGDVSQPQKLSDGYGEFQWGRSSLRNYINKRIEYEFSIFNHRTIQLKPNEDYWSKVFPKNVVNKSFKSFKEDSYDYVIRHTHYRLRDILRFTQAIVEQEINKLDISRKDFFSLNSRLVISEDTIRSAVRSTSLKFSEERLIEANRRFVGIDEIVNNLYGLSVPFSFDDLKKRISRPESDASFVLRWRDKLWLSGLIGVRIATDNEDALDRVKRRIGDDYMERSRTTLSFPVCFYIYSHSARELGLSNLISSYDSQQARDDGITFSYVIHPMMFEFLDARVGGSVPIGG
jgi:hypothetical protein